MMATKILYVSWLTGAVGEICMGLSIAIPSYNAYVFKM